jgi:hypothetical protein
MPRMEPRLTLLAALAIFPVHSAQAKAPEPPIVLQEPPVAPEIEVVSVQTTCGSWTFSFTITNRVLNASVLSEALRDGRPPHDPGNMAALREFLARVRNVHITGTRCVSEDEIDLSLYGLLRPPAPGQRDDAIDTFRIRFSRSE